MAIVCAWGQTPTGNPPLATIKTVPEGTLDLGDLNVHLAIPIVDEAGQTRSFARDALGRVLSATGPESGTTSLTYGNADAACGGYSASGSLVERKDAAGNVTCIQHDALGRITQITYPSGPNASATPTKTFVYDAATVDGQAMPSAIGRLAEAYTGSASAKITDEGFGYDSMGRATASRRRWRLTPGSIRSRHSWPTPPSATR